MERKLYEVKTSLFGLFFPHDFARKFGIDLSSKGDVLLYRFLTVGTIERPEPQFYPYDFAEVPALSYHPPERFCQVALIFARRDKSSGYVRGKSS